MSTFGDIPSPAKSAIDAATRAARAKQTPEVLNQRAVPRLSIDELNEMSLEDLHDKYLTARRDDRGPVETTLDFLDAPRNAILGALAPGLRAKAEVAGNKGAFGLGRVNAADILGEAGLKPGIVRGVLGFIGDVALDPLTYAGPPGWGARATTVGGRTIRTGVAGVRAIKRAERTGEATGVVKGVVDAAGGTKGLRTAVFGGLDAGSGGKAKAAVNRIGKWMGGEEERAGGLLADLADKYTTTEMAPEAAAALGKKIEARDAFMSQYGAGAGPAAIKIGRDASGKLKVRVGVPRGPSDISATSSLAHIPFTDISLLSVPAISRDAMAAATDLARAATTGERIGVNTEDAIRKSPRVTEIVGHTNTMRQSRASLRDTLAARTKFRADNAEALDLARGASEEARRYDPAWIQDQSLTDSITAKSESVRDLAHRVADIRRQVDDPAVPMTVGEMLYLKDRANVFSKEAAAMADELTGIEEKAKVRNALQTDQNAHIERSMDTIRRFADHDETARGSSSDGYAARSFLGFDPARPMESVVAGDINLVGQVSEEARPLLDQYDEALNELVKAKPGKGGSPLFSPDMDEPKIAALRDRVNTLRDRLHEVTAPLRTGKPATLQEVEESIRATANTRLGEQKKALQDIMEATPDQRADDKIMADVLRDSITATMDANLAARLSPIAHMTPEQMQVLKLHKDFMGSSDGMVGMAAMQLPRKMAEYVHGGRDGLAVQLVDRIDAMMRKGFGGPASQVGDMARHVRFMSGEGAQLEAARLLLEGRRKLATVAAKHNLQGRENELAKMATAVWVADHETRAGTKLFRDVDAAGQRVGVYRVLDDATKNPAAAIPLTPELHADLRVLAQDAKLFESMRDQSIKAGILSRFSARDEYFPNTLTPQARRYMQVAAKSGDGGAAAHARQLAIQSFEKARTHDSAVFMSRTTGKMEEVFNADRWAQSLSDAEIERIGDTAMQAKARNLKALLDEYDRIPDPPPMLMNDPERMNQLAASGKFAALGIAGDLPGGFMDSNLYTSMMRRLLDQERAIARESFLKDVIGGQAIPFKNDALKTLANHPPGTAVNLGNGIIGKAVKLGDNQTGIKVGDDIFRTLKGKAADYENPLIQLMGGDGAVGALYHQHTAEAIEKAAAVSTDPEFLKAIDFLTHVWKTGNLAHPAWMMANLIGDSMNFAAQDAGYIPAAIKFGKSALRMIWHARDPDQLAKIKFNLNGADVDGNQVMQALRGEPIFDAAMFNEPAIRAARQENFLGSRLQPLGKALSKQGISSDYSQALRTSLEANPSASAYAKVKAGASVASDRGNRAILEPWWRVNQKASEWMRLMAYLSQREQGVDHGGAVQRVIRAGFDYQNLTDTERKIFRRVFPFWAWLKNNAIYQTKLLLERPIYAGSLPLLQRTIEESLDGESRVPINQRPRWMREQIALQLGEDPESRAALLIGNLLPQEQAFLAGRLTQGISGAQSVLNQAVSSINPIGRSVIELGAGREFYSGRTIGATGDISPVNYVADQLVPRAIREIPKVARTAGEIGAVGSAARVAFGGRVQPMSDERIRVAKSREFQEEEDRLRKSIRTAEFRKDAARSLVKRAELLRLYGDMVSQGFDADVPKWAKARLAQFAP